MIPPPPSVRILPDAEALSRAAAEEIVRRVRQAVDSAGLCTVVLAGGSTPAALYALLAREGEPFRDHFPWDRTHFFWGDERHVPPDHPLSNYRLARETMLSRVPVPVGHVHRIRGELSEAPQAADDYESTLRSFFRLEEGGRPRFDLVLLGLGPDGHIASLFPGSEALSDHARLVASPWVERLRAHRITLTPPVFNNATCVLFLVSGGEKAEALRSALEGSEPPTSLPARAIGPVRGDLLWFADRQAARLLGR